MKGILNIRRVVLLLFLLSVSLNLIACGDDDEGVTPTDTTPPTVLSTSPSNNATGVAVNTSITATFSEAMNASTINTGTFTVRTDTTPISGMVTYSGTTATFIPSGNLNYNTTYIATITTGVRDVAGNSMASEYVWSFTTSSTPPNVLVSQTVTVGGGGGWAAVSFDASNGQRIRITLSSTDTRMEPYGFLEYPDGSSDYYPPCGAAQNGYNSIELLLNQTGRYTLTIFDGANLGGTVTVRVEVI